MLPLPRPVAEVCAIAKRDLAQGETLDQIGEYCYRAWVMTAEDARADQAIPCGLLAGCTTTAPIAKGALITHQNTKVPETSPIAMLRARQDRMLGYDVAEGADAP